MISSFLSSIFVGAVAVLGVAATEELAAVVAGAVTPVAVTAGLAGTALLPGLAVPAENIFE